MIKWGSIKPEIWKILERRKKQGKPTEPLDTLPPQIDSINRIAWDAFFRLGHTRSLSENGVPQPIKISEIHSYIDLFNLHWIDKNSFVDTILMLDYEYLVSNTKKVSSNKKTKAKKGKNV